MTLVKHSIDSYKISEASFDIDKEQFFCYVGMPTKEGVNVIKYTIWGDIMKELVPFVGMDYENMPQRIQRLWESGQEKCHTKATKFARKQVLLAQPKEKTTLQKIKDAKWYKMIFGDISHGQ